jgi:plasmid stabilization system protein ParE
MALEIFWSKRAEKNFDNILEFLLEQWGEKVASAFVKKVYNFLEILAEFPEIGTVENKEKSIRGFTIVKQVHLFYRIKGDQIILLSFFDSRRHPEKKRF